MNIVYELIFGTFEKVVSLFDTLYNFLFFEIDILDITISVWELLGGGAITILLVAWLIKKVVPVV